MCEVDFAKMEDFIHRSGLNQDAVSQKAGLDKSIFSMLLQGNRKCEVEEYVKICKALHVPVSEFLVNRST